LPSKGASFLRWTISPFNDVLTESKKIPSLLYILHVTKTGFTLSLIQPSTKPKANSTTAVQNNTEQYNIVFT